MENKIRWWEKLIQLLTLGYVIGAVTWMCVRYSYINKEFWTQALWTNRPGFIEVMVLVYLLGAVWAASHLLCENSKIMRFMRWSWLNYTPGLKRLGMTNIVLMPLKLVWPFRIVFIAGFVYSLPALAAAEETLFRGNINSGMSAVTITVIFAYVHVLMGVNLGVSTALLLPGIYFAYVYSVLGIQSAAFQHMLYNVLALALTFVMMKFGKEPEIGLAPTRESIEGAMADTTKTVQT